MKTRVTDMPLDWYRIVDRTVVDRPIHSLPTPALLLDRDACDRNLKRMARQFSAGPARLRPHFKNHKCIRLAQRQLRAGSAVGITCAKLAEAEVLAAHGVDDILIANQVVGPSKLERLARLAQRANVSLAADEFQPVREISQAMTAANATVGVLIEVDIGMGRCGVEPGRAVADLAHRIVDLPGIQFRGLQAYEGHAVYVEDRRRRAQLATEAMRQAMDSADLLRQQGISVPCISGGSTATATITGSLDGVSEIQAGTYATMDWKYHQLAPEFEIALSVLATVISTRPDRAVVDVGVKGIGSEFGPPRVKNGCGAEIASFLAEEHGVIRGGPARRVGDTVELIPSHACTTCNLHRQMFVHAEGRVVDVWPIEAAGCLT